MYVELKIARESDGLIYLIVNAQEFHADLDAIGVEKGSDGFYKNRPYCVYGVVDTRLNKLSSSVFLRAEYPAKFKLSGCYENPPSKAMLKALLASADEVMRGILEHYQPIDISMVIHKGV